MGASRPAVKENALVVGPGYRPGYFASIFSDFLRGQWMAREHAFTSETVMSHANRVELLEEAQRRDCRTYLYYGCTNSTVINAERINRGHHTPERLKLFEWFGLVLHTEDGERFVDLFGGDAEANGGVLFAPITQPAPPAPPAPPSPITGFTVDIPYWFVVLLTALLPGLTAIRTLRRRRRLQKELCPACGYDLRATPGRCPECGTMAAPHPCGTAGESC